MDSNSAELAPWVSHLYRTLHGTKIPSSLGHRLNDIIHKDVLQISDAYYVEFHRLHQEGNDLLAIEAAWRKKDPKNPLTKLIRAIMFIAEVSGEQTHVVHNSRLTAFIALVSSVLFAVVRQVRGQIQIKGVRLHV